MNNAYVNTENPFRPTSHLPSEESAHDAGEGNETGPVVLVGRVVSVLLMVVTCVITLALGLDLLVRIVGWLWGMLE